MHTRVRSILLVSLVLFVISTGAAPLDQIVEDFSTTARKHPLTSADWNTGAGEVRLFPTALSEIGSTPALGTITFGLTVHGDYVFAGDNGASISSFYIANPIYPYQAGQYGAPAQSARGIAIQGNQLFATIVDQLRVLDVSNPPVFTLVGSVNLNDPHEVAVDGDLAYVADGVLGLRVVNITNVASPTVIGSHPTGLEGVMVDGDHVFGGSSVGGLLVYDVQNPAAPAVIGTYPATGYWLTVSGDYAYVVGWFGLHVIDIQDPTTPILVGSHPASGYGYDVAVSGDRALITNDGGLDVFDIRDPTNPVLLGNVPYAGGALTLAVSGHRANVGASDGQMHVVDFAGLLAAPTLDASIAASGLVTRCIAVSGNTALVGTGSSPGGGVDVFDVTDPAAPVLLASTPAANAIWDVAVAGDRAYIADGTAGLRVLDITNPAAPTFLGSVAVTDDNFGVTLHGNYAYLAVDIDGVRAVDITNPAAPVDVGGVNTPGAAHRIAISGNHAYVADFSGHLQVLDITNPAAPTIVGATSTGLPLDVALSGDHAFTIEVSGFEVIDVLNPTSPVSVATMPVAGAMDLAVDGSIAYVLTSAGGGRLWMIDVSNPATPALFGEIPLPVGRGLAAHGRHVFAGGSYPAKLNVVSVFQDALNTTKNIGIGILGSVTSDPVLGVQLLAVHTDSIKWHARPSSNPTWLPTVADGRSVYFSTPTTGNVLWRSTHAVVSPLVNPACTQVTATLLHCYPQIESIADVGGDQGNQVRITWVPSGNDHPASPDQTVEYSIYRKVKAGFAPATPRAGDDGRAVLVDWDLVLTVPADGDSRYSAVVPTVADSTATGPAYFTFLVRARSAPAVYCDSPPDSGFSADNVPPYGPSGFIVSYNVGSNLLTWNAVDDPDVAGYRVYHGVTPNFVVEPQAIAVETSQTSWLDTSQEAWKYFYKLVTFDDAGNESTPIGPALVTGTPGGAPTVFALRQNTPNPFNTGTVIPYDLPREHAGRVSVRIYDVSGRLVRRIEERQPPGRHSFRWDGRDEVGARAASGVYFYRLEAGTVSATRKMVLLK
jgi:hypothetical protein